jgi:hypothetical protein
MNKYLLFIYTLFSASYDKNLFFYNEHIIGVTSLWMTIPIYDVYYTSNDLLLINTAIFLNCICFVSTLYWSNPRNIILLKLDRFLVTLFFLLMIFNSINIEIYKLINILILIILFYILSHIFYKMKYILLRLISHLTFRYIFYWWCHIIMISNKSNLLSDFITITIGYITHVIILYNINLYKLNYWVSCLILLCWITFCSMCITRLINLLIF